MAARFEWKGERVVAAMGQARTAALTAGGITLQRSMKRTLSGSSPSSPGSPPGVDRGGLRRSITYVVKSSVGVGTNLKYGMYMEKGATIRPKNVQRLPVPVNHAAKRMLRTLGVSGTGRVSLRTKNLQFIGRKGKDPLLVEQTRGGDVKKGGAVFVLKKQVKVDARPWAMPSFESARSEIQVRMQKAYGDVLMRSIAGGGGA